MPDDSVDPRTHSSRRLRSSLRFKTYSDAKLAGLFLDNDFPIVLFTKVFDVIVDAAFRSDEITFEDAWDMFDYISARRRRDALKRGAAIAPPSGVEPDQVATAPNIVPPLVLDLVVDRFIEDRIPFGVAAMEPFWESAFECNGSDFRNMSLVHRSWTAIAQRGLRHRAVVPYQHINKFLLSPLCGPWITEMIIYWTVDNSHIGVTKGDVWLLEALLERTPNLRSLSFNTSLVWPGGFLEPSFDVDICLEIISEVLPSLESLWLKHFQPSTSSDDRSLEICDEMHALCIHIPKMRSLKFLSIRSWGGRDDEPEQGQPRLNWDEYPPSLLKAVELDLSKNINKEGLTWLLKTRGNFGLRSLSVASRNGALDTESLSALQESLKDCLPEMEKLQLCMLDDFKRHINRSHQTLLNPFYIDLLLSCSKLVSLDLFVMDKGDLDFSFFVFPPCLERLAIHYHDEALRQRLSPPSTSRAATQFLQDIKKHIPTLPRLRNLHITASPKLSEETITNWDLDGFIHYMNEDAESFEGGTPEALRELCKERNVELACINNAFPRGWDVPYRSRH